MSVVAITREGFGRVWLFPDRGAALAHPLVQYGDAIFEDEHSLFDEYRFMQLPSLLRRLELGTLALEMEVNVSRLRELGKTDRLVLEALKMDGTMRDAYLAIEELGAEPPVDSNALLELVRSDRAAVLERRITTMAKAETATKEPKAPKTPKEPKSDLIAGHPPATRIKFGTAKDTTVKHKAVPEKKDKDGKVTQAAVAAREEVVPGKPYNGTDNNPKSRGAGERFAKYKNNATLKSLVEAGCTPADIKWDLEKGFIVIAA